MNAGRAKVVSINVGGPRNLEWQGRVVRTSIVKTAVDGPVRVGTVNLDGDEQSDHSVHGGPRKAVYVYPSEHYAYWRGRLPDVELPWGAFGENLTTEGLIESAVCVGDRLTIGTAEFAVTQPRMPCFKLTFRFRRSDMVKHFLQSGRPGFYLAVVRQGTISAGQRVTLTPGSPRGDSIAEIARRKAKAKANDAGDA